MDYLEFLSALRAIEERVAARSTANQETIAQSSDAGTTASKVTAKAWHEAALRHISAGDSAAAAHAWEQALQYYSTELELFDAFAQGLRTLAQDPVAITRRAWSGAKRNADGDLRDPDGRPITPAWQALCLAVLHQDWETVLRGTRRLAKQFPISVGPARNLAFALRKLQQPGRAQCVLAENLYRRGENRAAADAFLAAPQADAQSPDYLRNMLHALRRAGEEARAIDIAAAAAARNECPTDARIQWAEALADLNRIEEALEVYRAGARARGNWKLWLRARLDLPAVPHSQPTRDAAHARVRRSLQALPTLQLPTDGDDLAALEGSLEPNFYLYYGSHPGVAEARAFAQLVERTVAARYSEYTQPLLQRSRAPGDRLRIGYVTRHAYFNTVMRHFAGWIDHANRETFELHLFPLVETGDWMIGYLGAGVDVVHQLATDVTTAAREIREANLDLLVYVAIGMDSLTMRLAALRLAPVQCTTWGHPVTTGLSTVDYFISARGMEPENGNAHYTERLVTLPGVGAFMPDMPPPQTKTRAEFGLPEQRTIFVSPQSLFKYQPLHDGIYARIAQEMDTALFVFVESGMPAWTRTFQARIEASFRERGLAPEKHILFLPKMKLPKFLEMLSHCDVMLDTLDWSGGQTSYDALACGLPIVTLPGTLMRGRQTYGMLRQIGIDDTIATDIDDYVRIAVRLGRDPASREGIVQRIRENRHLLFGNSGPVQSLEAFYRWAVGAAQPGDEALFKLWLAPPEAQADG